MEHDDDIGNRAERKITAALTKDPFDRMLADMVGLPNGAHTKPAVVQHIDFYKNSQQYIIQTVRTDETITAFITQVSAAGSVRTILPASVMAVIDRQRASITRKLRSRHGRRIAEERAAAGHKPGFMKARGK
jgi:hypothetical protein